MDFRLCFVVVIFSLFSWVIVLGNEGKQCDLNDVRRVNPGCPINETCKARDGSNVGYCQCKPGYSRSYISGVCLLTPVTSPPLPVTIVTTVSPEHTDVIHQKSVSTGAITAAVLVPLLVATIVLLVLVGRRYNCLEKLRLLQGRRYEEVRIGQEDEDDDPPLA